MRNGTLHRVHTWATTVALILSILTIAVGAGVYRERINSNRQRINSIQDRTTTRLDKMQRDITKIRQFLMGDEDADAGNRE